MQAEVPPQAEMKMGGVNGFVPYASVATLLVSAMSGPPSMKVPSACRSCFPIFLQPDRKSIADSTSWAASQQSLFYPTEIRFLLPCEKESSCINASADLPSPGRLWLFKKIKSDPQREEYERCFQYPN